MSAQTPPGRGPGPNVPLRGGVDLAALAAAREAAKAAEERNRERAAKLASGDPQAVAAALLVSDVTEPTFQVDIIDKSLTVPVVVELWSARSAASAQLSAILEKLVEQDDGAWVLARVDVDAEPNIAAAFRVEAIPTVIAVLRGQPVPLFQGVQPEAAIQQVLTELIRIAAEQGMTGPTEAPTAQSGQPDMPEPAEPPADPRYDAAFDAFEAGDWDGAASAYQSLLDDDPADEDAAAGLARVEVMRRVTGKDPGRALAEADADPADVSAAMLAADFEMLSGSVRSAFDRLVETVRLTTGEDRQRAREHLLALFAMVGLSDPDVARARTALANALF